MEEISSHVLAVVESNLAGLSKTGRGRLRKCLPHLANLIEAQCPAVLFPSARGGITAAYGPHGVQPGDILLATATPESGVLLSLAE